MVPSLSFHSTLVLGQCALVAAGLGAVAFAPPAQGAMLLVPVGGSGGGIVNAAVSNGARLLGPGPLPGSIVVSGSRARILPAALAAGAFVTLGTDPGCDAGAEESKRKLA